MSDLNATPDENAVGSAAGQESAPPEGNEQAGSSENSNGSNSSASSEGSSQEGSAAPAADAAATGDAAVAGGSTPPVEEAATGDAGNAGAASADTTGETSSGSTAAASEDTAAAALDAPQSTGEADAGNAVDASASSASDAGSPSSSSGQDTAPDAAPVADVVRTPDAQMPAHPVYPAPAQPAPTTSPTPALAMQAADPMLAAIASATTIVNSAPATDLSQKTADTESDPHEQMLVIMRNSLEQVARDTGDFHAAQAFVHLVQIDAAALHAAVQGSIAQFFADRGVDLGTASDAQ